MYTTASPSERQKELYQLAESQSGYFTTKQAATLGYASNKRIYHVRAHNWIREHRGIYRLALFPEPERSDLMLWWLWSRDRSDRPTGVFSHQTGLSLHDLTDANPAKLDLTVPPNFRRGVPIPKVLRLHRDDVRAEDLEILYGETGDSDELHNSLENQPARSRLDPYMARTARAVAVDIPHHVTQRGKAIRGRTHFLE